MFKKKKEKKDSMFAIIFEAFFIKGNTCNILAYNIEVS